MCLCVTIVYPSPPSFSKLLHCYAGEKRNLCFVPRLSKQKLSKKIIIFPTDMCGIQTNYFPHVHDSPFLHRFLSLSDVCDIQTNYFFPCSLLLFHSCRSVTTFAFAALPLPSIMLYTPSFAANDSGFFLAFHISILDAKMETFQSWTAGQQGQTYLRTSDHSAIQMLFYSCLSPTI